ncbi:MAG: metallophosphoesterase [Bacteroidota bacterium]
MSYNLLILSDSHLFKSRDQELFGVNTYGSLKKLSNHIKLTDGSYDLLVALGDLSEDGHTSAYEHFHDLTKELAASSCIWIKGNHDQFDNVPGELAKNYIQSEWHMDPWSFIFLDTTINGKDEGELGEAELHRLDSFTKTYKERYILIFMHHQPIDVGSDFIDVLGLNDKQVFWESISNNRSIRGIVFGHIHQVFDGYVNGIRLLSMPATSMQFKPLSRELEFDKPFHGYRTITLGPDGSIDTKVDRITVAERS